MKTVGFIDYYLHEWHSDNYPEWLDKASDGHYKVTHCWGEIDSPKPGGLTNLQWADKMGITLCEKMEDVIEACDVLIVLAPDDPDTHERLCQLPLRSGKPVMVDKTFAPDKATAIRLIRLAESSGTPCVSTSALRYAKELDTVRRDAVSTITSIGGGDFRIYVMHQIEMIVKLLGTDALRVKAVGNRRTPTFYVEYTDGRTAMMICPSPGVPFQMIIDHSDNTSQVLTMNSDFFAVMMKELVRFFETGEIIVPHEETVAVMAIREACIKAFGRIDEWVAV